jgi:hypothetical protein
MAASTRLTPEQRIERARNAGKVAQSPATYAKNLVRDWPKLNSEQQARIRTVLSPIVGDSR